MAAREAGKLQRWIDLVSALLASGTGLTQRELRERIPGYQGGARESARRAFERDKDALRAVGVPIETLPHADGAEIRYRLRGDAFYLPYLAVMTERGLARTPRIDRHGYRALQECHLTGEDLALLADASRTLLGCGDPQLSADAMSAMGKLAMDLPSTIEGTGELQTLPARSRPDAGVLALLSEALHRRKQVTLTYYGIDRDETERRAVLPYGLAYTNGHWYLHAMDPSRGGIRQFRASRMRDVTVNPATPGQKDYEIPGDFDLAKRAAVRPAWSLGEDPPVAVTVRYLRDNGAVRVARQLGAVDPRDSALVHYQVRRGEVFLRWLLGMAGDAEPVAPWSVVEEYRAMRVRTMARHQRVNA